VERLAKVNVISSNCNINEDVSDVNDKQSECDVQLNESDEGDEILLTDDLQSVVKCSSSVQFLSKEQHDDKSLSGCWKQAERGHGNFVVNDGLLYHCEKF